MRTKKKVRTIEKTSKGLKLQIALSVLLMITSLFVMANAQHQAITIAGLGVFILSFVWWVATKMCIWWNHG
jgi:hypothetical protein